MNTRRLSRLLVAPFALSLLLAGCGEGSAREATSDAVQDAVEDAVQDAVQDAVEDDGAQSEEVEFGYSGDTGPEHWAELDDEWTDCADAGAQSPINLTDATEVSLPDPEFHYTAGDLELENNTHTVLAEEEEGSYITVEGHRYDLVQFHFHEGSEHTVDGRAYDGELHLVHSDDDGATAVVGVLFELGETDAALDEYFASLPQSPEAEAEIPDFDTAALLPADHRTYRYTGSLTTPPCSEGVNWFVMASPVQASAAQLEAFRSVIAANARPTQPLGGRELLLDVD